MIKIPVIILTYNNSSDLKHFMESIEKIKEKNNSNKVSLFFIIIDNNSEEDEIEKIGNILNNYNLFKLSHKSDSSYMNIENFISDIKKSDILYVQSCKNHGYSFSNNIGIKLSEKLGYKFALIANPDTEILNIESINKMYNILKADKQAGVLFPKVIGPYGELQGVFNSENIFYHLFYNFLYPLLVIPTKLTVTLKRKIEEKTRGYYYISSSIGCFFMLNIDIFNKVGFFDEKVFLYYEEAIIAEKLKRNNYRVIYFPSETIIHHHSYNDAPEIKNEYIKSKEYFFKEYKNYNDFIVNLIKSSEWIYTSLYSKIVETIKALNDLKRKRKYEQKSN